MARQQPRVRGVVREPASTALLPEINAELRRIAMKYGVTPSWVRATILADALKIRRQPRYYMAVVRKRRRAS
jgi:hypothetical protein